MKTPFSYKSNFFLAALCVSVAGHALAFGLGRFVPQQASFSVKKAPESMEIVLIEQHVVPQERKPVETKVIQTHKSPEKVKVEKIVKKSEPKEIQKAVVTPPSQGAIFEAEPSGLDNPAPVYPRIAQHRGWEGVVQLKVFVEEDGLPREVVVAKSAGYKVLDEAALKTVKKWQFVAARRGDHTFSSWINIPIRFQLLDR